jgi:hypothetical protein
MKKATQPLKLNRETVRQLSLGTLVGIAGGAGSIDSRCTTVCLKCTE